MKYYENRRIELYAEPSVARSMVEKPLRFLRREEYDGTIGAHGYDITPALRKGKKTVRFLVKDFNSGNIYSEGERTLITALTEAAEVLGVHPKNIRLAENRDARGLEIYALQRQVALQIGLNEATRAERQKAA